MPNMSLTKVVMPEQEPDVRNKNFEEVALGYTKEMAMEEATRSLAKMLYQLFVVVFVRKKINVKVNVSVGLKVKQLVLGDLKDLLQIIIWLMEKPLN